MPLFSQIFGIIFSPHIEDFIDQLIAETNQGYANSEIPVTVTKLCQEMATVHDTPSSGDLLDSFMGMKESYEDRGNILLQVCQEQTADDFGSIIIKQISLQNIDR